MYIYRARKSFCLYALSILAYIHKITNVSTGLLIDSVNYHTHFGCYCIGPGSCTWPMGPWETDLWSSQKMSELPETSQSAATEGHFSRHWPPQDAPQSSEKPWGLSLEGNASRGGQVREKWPSVAASWGTSGNSEIFLGALMSLSLWITNKFGALCVLGYRLVLHGKKHILFRGALTLF